MIINLTPHTVTVFKPETPDVIEGPTLAEARIVAIIQPSKPPVRLDEKVIDTVRLDGISVSFVAYGMLSHEPPQDEDTYYVVSLATALACKWRGDFLVPYREVRNANGTIIGCRALAKPV